MLLAIFLALDGFSQLLHHQSVALFTDNTTALSYLRKEGGDSIVYPQFRGSGDSEVLRGPFHPPPATVYSGENECPRRRSQPELSSPRLLVDPLPGGVSGAVSHVACHDRPVCHFPPTTGFSCISLQWWILRQRDSTRCYNHGITFRPTRSLPLVSFLAFWPRFVCLEDWS